MDKIKKANHCKCSRACIADGTLIYCWWDCKMVQQFWKNSLPISLNVQCELTYDLAILSFDTVFSFFSHVRLFATLWTVTRQAPLSMGFSRQDYWSGLPFPPSGDIPDPGIEPISYITCIGRQVFFFFLTTSAILEAPFDTDRDINIYTHRKICAWMYTEAFFTMAKNWNQYIHQKQNKWTAA